MLIVIRGAGDLASGVAVRLHRAGFSLVMTDLEKPTAIRREVSFCRAITDGRAQVEDALAEYARTCGDARAIVARGNIAVMADPSGACIAELKPDVLVDAILAKKNTGTSLADAPVVIALGPGFTAGADCHAVVETMRGHDLGRVYETGSALPNTGVPGMIGGYASQRLLRAPCDGVFRATVAIGDTVGAGDTVAMVDGTPVIAAIGGVVRGLLPSGTPVASGMKSGDIDPRGVRENCFTVSDKARAIGGGVLEAVLRLTGGIRNG